MSRIVVSEFLTLDGVMQAPGAPDEDTSDGFDKGGWQLGHAESDDALVRFLFDAWERTEGLLLGRRTYEIFAGYWPHASPDDPVGTSMNTFRKHVASTTLEAPLAWSNSVLLEGSVPDAVGALRSKPGKDIQVIGSGVLVQTLIEHDLVDEYRLMIYPRVLGKGHRLFRDGTADTRLRLVDAQQSPTGIVLARYSPA